jgi:hypothetical protein
LGNIGGPAARRVGRRHDPAESIDAGRFGRDSPEAEAAGGSGRGAAFSRPVEAFAEPVSFQNVILPALALI